MPTKTACPHCDKQLRLPDNLIGQTVRCPGCQETFTAAEEAPAAGVRSSRGSPPPPPAEDDRPSRRGRDYDEDEDRPSRRGRDEDDGYDRPRRRSRRRLEPHRAGTIFAFGLMAILGVLSIVFGPMAWMMGNADLAEMDAGRMDPEGRGMTNAGRIMGMISCILMLVSLVLTVVICGGFILIGVMSGGR